MHTPPVVNHIADAGIIRIDELPPLSLPPEALFKGWDASMCEDLLSPALAGSVDPATGSVFSSVHCWLVRFRGLTILVDAGVGNGKPRPFNPRFDSLETDFLERLKAAGTAPEDVDYVFNTHLHVDHVGWNTRMANGRFVPTFPRAKYVFSRSGQQFFADPANYPEDSKSRHLVYLDSVLPVLEAGQAELVDPDGGEFVQGISLHTIEGHCPGQMAVSLATAGGEILFVGDVAHHPIQVLQPELTSIWCSDPKKARASRLWALERAASNGALFVASHFPGASAGYIESEAGRFAWRFRQPDPACA